MTVYWFLMAELSMGRVDPLVESRVFRNCGLFWALSAGLFGSDRVGSVSHRGSAGRVGSGIWWFGSGRVSKNGPVDNSAWWFKTGPSAVQYQTRDWKQTSNRNRSQRIVLHQSICVPTGSLRIEFDHTWHIRRYRQLVNRAKFHVGRWKCLHSMQVESSVDLPRMHVITVQYIHLWLSLVAVRALFGLTKTL
jgi:hypothetical protein